MSIQLFSSPDDLKDRWRGQEFFRDEHIGYVYICECGNAVKIGQTGKPLTRLFTHKYMSRVYGENDVRRIAITSHFSFYKELEHFLHLRLAEYRRGVREEFFSISFDSALHVLRSIIEEPFCKYLFTIER